MVNTKRLREIIADKGYSISEVADHLGCDKTTLYRKINGGGDKITVREAEKLISLLHLSVRDVSSIFFAP